MVSGEDGGGGDRSVTVYTHAELSVIEAKFIFM